MTKQERIEQLEREVSSLTASYKNLMEENNTLKDRLADKLWPAEQQIEEFEQTVLKATKTLIDQIRRVE
jgi:archaellum component FlaC